MKTRWLLLSGFVLSSCIANNCLHDDSVAQNNLYHIARIRKGMSEKEVLYIMRKPYSYETFQVGDDVYDVWFYVTRTTGLGQTRMVPQNLTPLTFKNGILVGTEYYWYYFAMKEQAAEMASEAPQEEPKKTPQQEDVEFEKALKAPPQEKTPPTLLHSANTSVQKIKVGMSDTEVINLVGEPERLESYTLNQDVYEIWFYKGAKSPLTFKNGTLVSTKTDYYERIKKSGSPNKLDSYDRGADRLQEEESEQNFDYW
jgi:outer membrane protein assembly factor BamE (lipoprotein component of BamABCDE complex)